MPLCAPRRAPTRAVQDFTNTTLRSGWSRVGEPLAGAVAAPAVIAASNLLIAGEAAASSSPRVQVGDLDIDVGALFFAVTATGMGIFITYLARRRERIKQEVRDMGIDITNINRVDVLIYLRDMAKDGRLEEAQKTAAQFMYKQAAAFGGINDVVVWRKKLQEIDEKEKAAMGETADAQTDEGDPKDK